MNECKGDTEKTCCNKKKPEVSKCTYVVLNGVA